MKDSIAYVPLRDGCSQLINSVEHDGDGVPGPQSSGSKTRTCSIGEGFVILCGLDYVLAPWPGRVQPTCGGRRVTRGAVAPSWSSYSQPGSCRA